VDTAVSAPDYPRRGRLVTGPGVMMR
jgi:hypothetical protein